MIKKVVKYTDFDGVEREEEFRFNLTQAELFDMETGIDGGFTAMVKKIIAAKDSRKIIDVFKQIMMKAYGVKSDDGRRFIKNPQVLEEFMQTQAYSKIYMELATDADAAAEFINGVVADAVNEANQAESNVVALPKA